MRRFGPPIECRRTTAASHIWLDDRGVAWIDQTNTKVIKIAFDTIAHGWSPEEIHFQHALNMDLPVPAAIRRGLRLRGVDVLT